MTETDWLASTDPRAMLRHCEEWPIGHSGGGREYHRHLPSDRKLRLFAVAWWSRWEPHNRRHESRARYVEDGKSPWQELLNEMDLDRVRELSRGLGDELEKLYPVGAVLLREIVGNPFRPVRCSVTGHQLGTDTVNIRSDGTRAGCDCHWLTPAVLSMAQTIYDSRDWISLPALADLLEEAGCDSEELLRHLRDPGPHVRGCWVLDLLLGKE